MSKIAQLIEELCPDGVEYKELGEVCLSIRTGLNPRNNFRLNTDDAENYYCTVKEITTGKILFSNKTDRINDTAVSIISTRSHLEQGDVLFSGIGTIGKVAVVDIPTRNWNCSESIFLLKPDKKAIVSRFLMYILQTNKSKEQYESQSIGSTLKGVRMGTLSSIKIPLPPLLIQEEIVRILDTFTETVAELQAELQARKKQYEYYREKLLTFETGDVQYVELGEVCAISRGRVLSKDYLRDNIGVYPVYSSQTSDSGILGRINTYDYDGEYLTWTTDGAYAGSIFYRNGKFSITNICGLLKIVNTCIHIKFLYYYLTIVTKSYVHYGMGNPKLMSNVIKKIKIPLPSLSEQERIVSILDRFDALTNSITEGLPAEIEARQKQYEYYRDTLLTFKKKEVQ